MRCKTIYEFKMLKEDIDNIRVDITCLYKKISSLSEIIETQNQIISNQTRSIDEIVFKDQPDFYFQQPF